MTSSEPTLPLDLLAILGPTVSGKTSLAVALSDILPVEMVSADSRQVFKGMDLGTGKDLDSYMRADGSMRAHHLIDCRLPGEPFSLQHYLKAFDALQEDLSQRNLLPLLVGGTGLYIESVLSGKRSAQIPPNPELREELALLSKEDLRDILLRYPQRQPADLSTQRRIIRAIEIAHYKAQHPSLFTAQEGTASPIEPQKPNSIVFGLQIERSILIKRIEDRLERRLQQGMIAEVRCLLSTGVPRETLISYGLEYRHIVRYLDGECSLDEMQQRLAIAIRQFAKRQVTWFRGMEKRGFPIHWIDGTLPVEQQVQLVLKQLPAELRAKSA